MNASRYLVTFILLAGFSVLGAQLNVSSITQTKEDIYIQMKEELQHTVDIYKIQVEILTMTVSLQQQQLQSEASELAARIEELKSMRQYEGKESLETLSTLQDQLNNRRGDLDTAGSNLEQLSIRVTQSGIRVQEYYDRVNTLAREFISEVESNREPDLDPSILTRMRESYKLMSTANISTGMDKRALDSFLKAVEEYITLVSSKYGSMVGLDFDRQQLLDSLSAAQVSQDQYAMLQSQLDQLKQMLGQMTKERDDLQAKLDELKRTPLGRIYQDKIYFASGSADLSKDATKILKEFAASVPPTDDYRILITGYADTTPIGSKLKAKYATNWELSLARSSRVVNYMLETLKFPPEKIIIAGKGEYDDEQNPDDKQLSRRVEFRFVPRPK